MPLSRCPADSRIPVLVIFAPTACGKTALAEELFGGSSLFRFKGQAEVISADSQAVYKGLDIGTAKPSASQRAEIPYHLIDTASPQEQFSLGHFMEAADRLCGEIWSRKNIPVVLGGTGFYIRNFLLGAPAAPESRPEIRSQIQNRLASAGREALYAELEIVDPASAKKISPHDGYRICRALEVFYSCGTPLSSFALPSKLRSRYSFCTLVLHRSIEELRLRISSRVEQMFAQGLEQEVERLRKNGITEDCPAMKAIGYREFFIEGLSPAQIKERIKTDSCRYARKQCAFMRGIPGAVSADADDKEKIREIVLRFFSSWLL
ncbi:MAG: tRNA (adenosine(37)-N6)-dimethylallyltransferase MiaA [Treponema sp.]|nr:tRNA (adenosine(37)-N6)-dimethylallyltransferase MiaA [Treponema sp.]